MGSHVFTSDYALIDQSLCNHLNSWAYVQGTILAFPNVIQFILCGTENMNLSLNNLVIFASTLSISTVAIARPSFRCNREQTSCVIDKKDATVGDNILFINKYDEVVAHGTIEQISGSERTVKIEKRSAPILRSDRFALVDLTNPRETSIEQKEYQKPSDASIEGYLGVASIRSSGGIPAYVFGSEYNYRISRKVYLFGGADVMIANGEASTGSDELGIDTETLSATGVGALGGVAVRFFEHSEVQPRVEGGLGFLYVNGSVGGDGTAFDNGAFQTGFNQGFGLYSRLKGSLLYKMEYFTAEIGTSTSYIHHTVGYAITIGAIKDLD